MNLLVTSVGRRRYVVEALIAAKPEGASLFVADVDPMAPALHVAGVERLDTQEAHDDTEERLHRLIELASQNAVRAVLSLHDYEGAALARLLSDPAQILFVGPDASTAEVTLDKHRLAQHARAVGVLTPDTYTSPDWIPPADGEWVMKDRWGSGSSGLKVLDACDVAHLPQIARNRDPWVLQPKLHGQEYNVDLFFDCAGTLSGHCVKRKLAMRGGETDRAEVLISPPPQVLDAAVGVMRGLRVVGNVDIDVILTEDGEAFVIDVNPRFGGGYAFSNLAGYEAARATWELMERGTVTAYLAPTSQGIFGKYIQPFRYDL